MTGINIQKERVVVSPRLIAPRKCCGESIDDRATAFKAAVYSSLRSNSLDPDSATKAMSGSSLGILRKGYEDTDGRKREFSADARPGVKEMKPGIRVDVASTYEPGKKLVLFPSLISQNSISTMPNMGWLDENPKLTFQQCIEKEKRKPTIQLTIYDVDKKTGEVKQDSAKKVDPFAPISGMSFEERQRQLKKLKIMQPDMKEKKLPGRSLGSMIPGGSLVARFAGRFGVLMDERNKFRCPPGTPAANQFTDMFGSNCFGFSGSRFARYAARQAQNLFPDSQQEDTGGFRNNASSFFKFLHTGTWNVRPLDLDFSQYPEFSQNLIDIEDIERARVGRTVSYDAATGERIPSTDWTSIDLPENMRLFKHGMANAQRAAAARDARVNSLQTQLGVDTSEIARAENDDLVETFEKLRESGLWYVDLDTSKDANTRQANLTTSRMTPFQVREFMKTRLEAIPDWNRLSQKEKDALLEADVKRYYETERGLLESLLDQFIKNPAAARFLQTIEYDLASTDEAGTSFSGGGTRGPIRGRISINMANILKNQELMLPNLRPDQRLGVAAVGAATDAAGQEVVADFLVNANHAARRMAGLVGGPKTFAAFIGTHEFIHLYQGQAFLREAERKMQLPGGLEVPVFDRNSRFLGNKVVRSMDELTGADLFQLMDQMNDSIDVKDLDNALSKIENVRMLAGNYPEQYLGSERWALEASAEIGALREVGLIWGEDVDSALSFIDEARARPTLLNRVDSDIDADAADLDSTTNPLVAQPSGVNIPVDQMDLDQLDDYITSLTPILDQNNKIERDELAEYLSGIDELPESNMIDEAALHLAQVDTINEFYIDPLSSADILDDPNVDPALTDLRRRHRDLLLESYQKRADISQKKHDELRKTWRKKYGVGTKGELDRFDQRVLKAREQAGLWTPEQARMAAQQISIDELTDRAKKISPDEIKEEIVRSTRLMPSVDSDSIQALELATGIEILKSEYVDRAAASGDKRSRARIMRDLEEMIEETISPKPKAAIKFKKVEDAKTFADKERARHRRSITKEQAAALREVGDFSESPIALMLSPELQVQLGRSMNRVAARRRRNNLSIDEKKANEADLQDQVKNILLPVLEAIDNSSVSESFEIEAMIDIDSNKIRGNATGREIVQEGFVSGFVSNGKVKFRDLPEAEQKNSATLKTGKKVTIRVKEGDRGIFPNIKDSKSQNFVMPPGSYTIVGRGEDNSLILEVSRQMDTVEVTDNLLNGLSNGYTRGTAQIVDDKIWRDGASRKIRPIVDQAILDMRSKGRVTGPASKDADSIKETNSKINGELADLDGYFGEGIFSEDGKFSSGSVGDDILGPRESKAQRTARRKKQIASDVTELRAVLSGRGSKKYPDLSADSIDPDTREMLLSLSTAELQDKVEEIGYRFHSGLDRRVRVRMRQEDIDELSRSGKFRSRTADSTYSANTGQRRVERLAGMEPVDRASRFSSGVVQNSAQLKERMEKENQIAKDATEIFDKIIKLESLDNLGEDEIKDLFGDSIKRSNITSVSETNKNVYEAADPATAIALMMAGHHATVAKQDLALTKQSLKQFQDIVEKGASERIEKNHPSWLRFKAEYAKENPREDLDLEETLNKVKKLYGEAFTADLCFLYDPEKNLLCSGHIGIEREKMPQLNGRTTGHDSAAIRMLKSGRAKGKWIKNGKDKDSIEKKHPKISKEESTEQYLSRLTSEGVDEKIIQDYRDSIKYDGIKSKHPAKGRDNPPLSEEDAEWFYANTNWTDTEVDLEEEFIEFAKKTIPPSETGESVISKEVIPSEYAPSQSQLLGKKVDDTNERMLQDALAVAAELEDEGFVRGSAEFREKYLERIFGTKEDGERRHWWTGAILTTKDGFILDGHHRWAGLTVANMSLPEELQIPLRVNEFQTNIIEGLSLGKVFQDQFGIKEAKLKNENPWKEGVIDAIDGAEVDGLKESVTETAGIKLDELYEAGEFIKLGSVGLRNKPDYVEAVKERKRLAESRRPGPAARSRQRELSDLLEAESRSSSGSFSSGGATPITKAQKTKKLEAVLDASLSRSNVNKKDKESIKFAVGLINSFTERRVSEETAEKIGVEILNRSGYDIAKLSLDEMASVGKIEKNLPQRILDKITSGEDRTPGFSSGADTPTAPAPPSVQLQPTESIDEAKRTGRPLSVLRPGTMPPKTQELYDTYLRQVGDEDAPVSLNSVVAALRGAISEEYEDLGFDSFEIRIITEALTNHLLIKGNKQEMTLLGRGWSEEERFEDSVEILEKADIVIAVDSSILEKLITDGRFKTQFETKTSRGSLVPDMRQATDVAQLGYHPNVAPEMRPVYGYLTTGGTIDKDRLAGVKQYGDLQFVMKRGTHSRSTYTTNDSLQGGYTPSPMGVPSADAAQDKRTPGMYSEAQIHGGVSLEDVDYVVVNVGVPDRSYWQDNKVSEKEFESISGMLTKVGIRVVPVRDGEVVDVWNGGNIIPEPPADVAPEPEPVEAVA